MQVMRTVIWVIITIILVSFIAMNWDKAPVNFWPLEDSYLHFEWPVGVIALIFFLLGFLPMWLFNRAQSWRHTRRIDTLENSLRAAASVTPTQLDQDVTASQSDSTPDGKNED